MTQDRASPQETPFWTRRMVEWSILALVILLLVLGFSRQMRVLQGQAELSAIKTMLGGLRTAFVLDHLHKQTGKGTSAAPSAQHNPFELLQHYPVNYRGEMNPAQAVAVPLGSWVFDPVCVCAGYLPIWSEWFDSPSGELLAWYRISGASGPLQLTAKEAYFWQGQIMN